MRPSAPAQAGPMAAFSNDETMKFKLPEVPEGRQWVLLIDTNNPTLSGDVSAFGAEYLVTGRSLLLLFLERSDAPARAPRRTRQKRRPAE